MTINAYTASVPVFIHMMDALKNILEKARLFESEKNINFSTLPNMRLAPDMFPLTKQVQIASDTAKFCVARLANIDAPKWEDHEATLADLINRVEKTIDFLKCFKEEQFLNCEEKAIAIKAGGYHLNFTGERYQLYFAIPNLYFHITTAYNILRHAGVPLGKKDFLGG